MRINRSRIASDDDREVIDHLGIAGEQAVRLDVVRQPDAAADHHAVGTHVNRIHRRGGVGGVVDADLAGIDDGNRAIEGDIQRRVIANAGRSVGWGQRRRGQRRGIHGQPGNGTGDRAGGVGGHQLIIRNIGSLRVGDGQRAVGLTGDGRAVLKPLQSRCGNARGAGSERWPCHPH